MKKKIYHLHIMWGPLPFMCIIYCYSGRRTLIHVQFEACSWWTNHIVGPVCVCFLPTFEAKQSIILEVEMLVLYCEGKPIFFIYLKLILDRYCVWDIFEDMDRSYLSPLNILLKMFHFMYGAIIVTTVYHMGTLLGMQKMLVHILLGGRGVYMLVKWYLSPWNLVYI